jgi:hypothetical protein
LRTVHHLLFSIPTTSNIADIHPLNDRWPEKLPYEKKSLVLPGSGKPGHSGMSLAEFGAIQTHTDHVFLRTVTGMASPRTKTSDVQLTLKNNLLPCTHKSPWMTDGRSGTLPRHSAGDSVWPVQALHISATDNSFDQPAQIR